MSLPLKLAIVVPTKDRREDLGKLLDSFSAQTRQLDQIVLVDGGDDVIEDLVASHASLPITYLRVVPPGFTKQKNAGTAAVREDIDLVGYLDDDIVLEPDAIERMLSFWESAPADAGGAEFHITNMSPDPPGFFNRFFGTHDGRGGGTLLPSGVNVKYWPIERTTEVEWLAGGATVWRREIVEKVPHDEWFTGYGHMDDADFSIAVGEQWRLFVVADARLAHYERPLAEGRDFAFGVYDTVTRYYLVKKHPERFSVPRFLWATTGKLLGRTWAGLRGDARSRQRARGYLRGLLKVLRGDLTLTETSMK